MRCRRRVEQVGAGEFEYRALERVQVPIKEVQSNLSGTTQSSSVTRLLSSSALPFPQLKRLSRPASRQLVDSTFHSAPLRSTQASLVSPDQR